MFMYRYGQDLASEMPPAGARPSRMESSDPAGARSSTEPGILTEVGSSTSPCFDESSSESEERPPKSDRTPQVRFMTAKRPRTGTATQAASSRMNTMATASELPAPP